MSDTPQGPGWWQASDGKWYPPESAPGGGSSPVSGGGGATLDIGEALSYGWNKFVQYIGQIIVIVAIIVVVQVVFLVIRQVITGSIDSVFLGLILGSIFTAIGIFISFLLQAGLIRAALAITRGEKPEPSMLFETDKLAPYAVASVIVSVLIFVGLIFCCIPGLIIAFFTYFFGFYIIDKDISPVESISNSVNLVKNNFGQVFLFMLVVVVLQFITCGLASGVTFIAMAYAYKKLNGEPIAA